MRKKNYIIFGVILFIALVGWFISFKLEQQSAQYATNSSSQVLKIESEYWPGSYWVEVASKKGWFQEAGLHVQLIDASVDYNEKLQEMVDGKMDENNFTLYDLMKFNANGADLVAIINTDVSSGTEGIITKNIYPSLASLKGKRIGTGTGTYLQYILDQALKRENMTLQDITLVNIDPDNAVQELDKGTIDAALTWEPFIGRDIKKYPQYHKIFDTSEILGAVPSIIAFHKSFIAQHPDTVQSFVNVWNKTTAFMLENPEETNQIIADWYGKSQDATVQEAESYTHIDKISNLQQNKTAFTYAAGLQSLYSVTKIINNYMTENNVIKQDLDATTLFNPQFIRAL